MRNKIRSVVEHKWFVNGITTLIVFNFFTIFLGTEGYDLEVVEACILFVFTVEVGLKLFAYGTRQWSKDGWNLFDASIVTLGILPIVGVPLPEGFSGARALRLVRLLGRIPSTKILIEAIFKSAKQLGGVGLLTGLFLMIFTLMATQSFQTLIPEHFGSFGTSLTTLLSLATFSSQEVVGVAWEKSVTGSLLVFPGFFLSVPLMALNMIIAVLSNAVEMTSARGETEAVTRADLKELNDKLDHLERLLREKRF